MSLQKNGPALIPRAPLRRPKMGDVFVAHWWTKVLASDFGVITCFGGLQRRLQSVLRRYPKTTAWPFGVSTCQKCFSVNRRKNSVFFRHFGHNDIMTLRYVLVAHWWTKHSWPRELRVDEKTAWLAKINARQRCLLHRMGVFARTYGKDSLVTFTSDVNTRKDSLDDLQNL